MAFMCQIRPQIPKVLMCSEDAKILSPICNNKPVEKKICCTRNSLCSHSNFRKTQPKEKLETCKTYSLTQPPVLRLSSPSSSALLPRSRTPQISAQSTSSFRWLSKPENQK